MSIEQGGTCQCDHGCVEQLTTDDRELVGGLHAAQDSEILRQKEQSHWPLNIRVLSDLTFLARVDDIAKRMDLTKVSLHRPSSDSLSIERLNESKSCEGFSNFLIVMRLG
jgi:hypothetical protein